jgi:hypothetical protein
MASIESNKVYVAIFQEIQNDQSDGRFVLAAHFGDYEKGIRKNLQESGRAK